MRSHFILFVAAGLALTACGADMSSDTVFPSSNRIKRGGDAYDTNLDKGMFDGSLNLFGGGSDDKEGGGVGSGIAVNSFLWRAALDTVSFMPLSSADPFGGVILTDWYSPPEAPSERFKLNIFILDRQLRADGLRVAIFKETEKDGVWRTATTETSTTINIENRILERARELRLSAAAIRGNR
ncbi:MAG: DUF3576 domain-containing protein [Alphaproteobacteria bacterium]